MKDEVSSAAKFLSDKLKERHELSNEHCELFRTTVEELMCTRFKNHWFPDKPLKGNAFRCLNINVEECCLDPLLREAAAESNVKVDDLTAAFPSGLALWVDPCDVSYRLGRGSISPIYRRYNPSKTQPSLPYKKTKFQNHKDRTFARPQVNYGSQESQLNSQAPVFTPKVNQNLSNIWTKNWQNTNAYTSSNQKKSEEYYSFFQKSADQGKYNRFHWHREEDSQQDQQAMKGFEFRNLAQEVY